MLVLLPQTGSSISPQDLVVGAHQLSEGSSQGSSSSGDRWDVSCPAEGACCALCEALSRWTCLEQLSKDVTPVHPNSFWQTVSLCIYQVDESGVAESQR